MDETRTILITTHQVEEVENLLTDVLFIDRGPDRARLLARRHRHALCRRRRARPTRSKRRAPNGRSYERRMLGKTVCYFEHRRSRQARRLGRAAHAERRRPVRRQTVGRLRMNVYRWLIRREFWENRAIWMIPAADRRAASSRRCSAGADIMVDDAPTQAVGGHAVLSSVSAVFFLVMGIYSGWYLLDCLYADRRDRSVLFWKSLPISDAATVLSKLADGMPRDSAGVFHGRRRIRAADGRSSSPCARTRCWAPTMERRAMAAAAGGMAVSDLDHGDLVSARSRLPAGDLARPPSAR